MELLLFASLKTIRTPGCSLSVDLGQLIKYIRVYRNGRPGCVADYSIGKIY